MARLWMMSIHGSALIMAVLAARILLRKYPRELSYALWIMVLMRLLCPIFIESPMSLWPEAWRTCGGEGAPLAARELLRLVYFAGVLLLAAVFVCQYLRMCRRVAPAVHEKDNIWLCQEISSPFVMGFIKPRIYLPFDIPGSERVYVIPHEMMHIRHGDLWVRPLALTALCLHWWNPLVWYGIHKMFQDMEMYCDEAAMEGKSLEARKEYSSAMLEFAVRQSAYTGALSFGQSDTEKRVRNILKNKKKSVWAFLFIILFGQFCVPAFFTVPL